MFCEASVDESACSRPLKATVTVICNLAHAMVAVGLPHKVGSDVDSAQTANGRRQVKLHRV